MRRWVWLILQSMGIGLCGSALLSLHPEVGYALASPGMLGWTIILSCCCFSGCAVAEHHNKNMRDIYSKYEG